MPAEADSSPQEQNVFGMALRCGGVNLDQGGKGRASRCRPISTAPRAQLDFGSVTVKASVAP